MTSLPRRLRKARRIVGHRLAFRDAAVDDAEFILGLRTDAKKGRHLSPTAPELTRQVEWLRDYGADDTQAYFVIEDAAGERVGTVRLYDERGDSFSWGSWIIRDGAPASCAVESALIVYRYALALGFARSHFDVRRANRSVWEFHERFGARRTGASDMDYFYEIDKAAIEASLQRFHRYLPEPIRELAD